MDFPATFRWTFDFFNMVMVDAYDMECGTPEFFGLTVYQTYVINQMLKPVLFAALFFVVWVLGNISFIFRGNLKLTPVTSLIQLLVWTYVAVNPLYVKLMLEW